MEQMIKNAVKYAQEYKYVHTNILQPFTQKKSGKQFEKE